MRPYLILMMILQKLVLILWNVLSISELLWTFLIARLLQAKFMFKKYKKNFLMLIEITFIFHQVTQDCQLNSLIGFFSSVIGLHGANFDIDDLQQMIIYSSIFCFSQDVPLDLRHHMEIKIRELYECRFVPTEQSIFDYFYDPKTKMWKGLKDHPMCSKAQMKAEVILLR